MKKQITQHPPLASACTGVLMSTHSCAYTTHRKRTVRAMPKFEQTDMWQVGPKDRRALSLWQPVTACGSQEDLAQMLLPSHLSLSSRGLQGKGQELKEHTGLC